MKHWSTVFSFLNPCLKQPASTSSEQLGEPSFVRESLHESVGIWRERQLVQLEYNFIIHKRPAGEVSGRTGVLEMPQLEVITQDLMPGIAHVQNPMPHAWQDTQLVRLNRQHLHVYLCLTPGMHIERMRMLRQCLQVCPILNRA